MNHSLPQVDIWSIWKRSCNQPIWAQNWTNSVWHEIFRIIQNPWRIRRSCNYKSFFKLHLLSPQIFWEFFSPLRYFPMDNSISTVIFELENQIQRLTCQWCEGRRQAHLSAPFSQLAATHHCGILRARVKSRRCSDSAVWSRRHPSAVSHRPTVVCFGRRCSPLSFPRRSQHHKQNIEHCQVLLSPEHSSSLAASVPCLAPLSRPRGPPWCPMPSSLTTDAISCSSSLAPVSPSTESLPPPMCLNRVPDLAVLP
jgi:hypothetical protein